MSALVAFLRLGVAELQFQNLVTMLTVSPFD